MTHPERSGVSGRTLPETCCGPAADEVRGAINAKAAKALSLTLSQLWLCAQDEVMQ